MSLPSPVDQAVRDRIARALDDTLFVEAGAGTGKTTALVSRIVALVRSGLTTIDRIAAITFTEAAASELREKVRLDLEKEAKCPSLEQGARERCSRAVGNLESSFIQTLHSFAGALLRERPLDAGLPPTFDIVEEIEADISFEDRWRLWLDEALDSPDLAPHFLRCLSLGLRLEDLRQTAKAFHDNHDLLYEPFPLEREPESRAAEAVAGAAPELRRL
ncbi:MAG: UvrD-helicase domain-containing protein, partial [Dehalococcoidia bacterium]|nr:UvrD-helicase domain-containing protein [Dehalococcoidia bacterium]